VTKEIKAAFQIKGYFSGYQIFCVVGQRGKVLSTLSYYAKYLIPYKGPFYLKCHLYFLCHIYFKWKGTLYLKCGLYFLCHLYFKCWSIWKGTLYLKCSLYFLCQLYFKCWSIWKGTLYFKCRLYFLRHLYFKCWSIWKGTLYFKCLTLIYIHLYLKCLVMWRLDVEKSFPHQRSWCVTGWKIGHSKGFLIHFGAFLSQGFSRFGSATSPRDLL